MNQKFEYTFTGKLSEDFRSLRIDYALQMMRLFQDLKDIPLEITIKKFRKQRTLAQNRWIWGYAIITVQAWTKERTGSYPSKEALYAFFRSKIIGDEVIIEEIDGAEVLVLQGKRFSQCNTVEFSERCEKIINYYAERGLELKFPDSKSNNLLTDFIKQQRDE